MNFTIRQLEAFREVMRTGGISEASRVLNKTQPTVSAMIASLEEALHFKLFLRQKGRLVARPEAYFFLDEVKSILDRLDHSARIMDQIKDSERGSLKIACLPAAATHFLPHELAVFLKDKPEVQASLIMRSSTMIADMVASQQFDIGLAETPQSRQTIKTTEFNVVGCCAIHADDPLANEPFLTPKLLSGRPAALLFEDHETAIQQRRCFADAGSHLNQRFELQTFQPALELVENGLCYCLCDLLNAETHRIGVRGKSNVRFLRFLPGILSPISILEPAQRPQSVVATAFAQQLIARMSNLNLAQINAAQAAQHSPQLI